MTRAAGLLLLLALLVGGCVQPDPHPRFTPAWEEFDPTEEGWFVTRGALLCADCQFHNLLSQPLPERNLSAEAAEATAIRPPQLDLFSPEVLEWILENDTADKEVVLHLGDATNLATTGEFERFVESMSRSPKPWFMAPGNHDIDYFGVYTARDPEVLKAASFRGGEAMDKGRFIRRYVATLLRQQDAGCQALRRALGLEIRPDATPAQAAARIPASFEWYGDEDVAGLLDRICWKIDEEQPWRSFILQGIYLGRIDQRGVQVFLLDSCQYTRRPVRAPNAWRSYPVDYSCGLTGEMLPDQLRKIREWLEARNHGAVFACHHPFEVLAARSRTNLGWLWREYRVSMMVTAHTHAGYYAHHDLGGNRDQIELNIGSTSDWPMEWRTLQGFVNPDKETVYIRSVRNMLVDVLRRRGGFFDRDWEIPLGARDDYRGYKRGQSAKGLLVNYYLGAHYTPYWLKPPRTRANKAAHDTEVEVKDTLLWTFYRLVKHFPTDPDRPAAWPTGCENDQAVMELLESTHRRGSLNRKVLVLEEVYAFERSRGTHDPKTGAATDDVRKRYKISQAVWASRFMAAQGRRLRVEDDLIAVEWEGTKAKELIEREQERE
ncbi:MAG: metallophosphoesterase family protein [Planctomycetota bacterium]|jgi:predicted phosphodiesterase